MKTENILFVLLILFQSTFGQSGIFKTNATSGNIVGIRYEKNSGIYYGESVQSYGQDQFNAYRTAIRYNLSSFVPANAINVRYYFFISCADGWWNGQIVLLDNSSPLQVNNTTWNLIGNGGNFVGFNQNTVKYDITSEISRYSSNGIFTVGIINNSSSPRSLGVVLTAEFTTPVNVTVNTNYGCSLYMDGNEVSSGTPVDKWLGQSLSVAVKEQLQGLYNLVWNDTEAPINKSAWILERTGLSDFMNYNTSNNYTIDATYNGGTITGYLKKKCNVNFTNSSSNPSLINSINVNNTNYLTPTPSFNVIEGNTISAQAIPTINGNNYIKYRFDHWSDNSTSYSKTFTINGHQTITAYYKGYATTKNVHFINIIPGQPICLDWDAHDNAGVTQYKVWRYPKYGATTCIATLGSSVTSFTDYEYVYSTGSPEATVMFYSVTAYYSPDQTWGDHVWRNTAGELGDPIKKINVAYADSSETVAPIVQNTNSLYSLNNSPNPFNPTTQIHYSLPETEQVTIKVFNMLGKEVTELVNAVQRKGEHVVTFNADNLSSGVYIYTIQTPHYTSSKKMILLR